MSRCLLIASLFLMIFAGCSKKEDPPVANSTATTPTVAKLTESAFVPTVSGGGATFQKGSVTVSSHVYSKASSPLVRLNDPWNGKEVTVELGNFSSGDFGVNGSFTLTADVLNYPFSGGAYAVLTSFYVDTGSGTIEFVNTTNSCRTTGMWSCSGGSCSQQSSCSVQSPSSFQDRDHWEQHQIPPYGYVTTNSFPRCDASVNSWSCPANLGVLPSGQYFAKYVLMSDRSASVGGTSATLRVRAQIKKDTLARTSGNSSTGSKGAINLNLILVGNTNIAASETQRGQQNYNLLMSEVNSILSQASGVYVGDVKVYAWSDSNGGSEYSAVDYSQLGEMFQKGSSAVLPSSEGNSINVFLVSDINYSEGGFTILGISGGLFGPPVHGTESSGVAFSTFDQMQTFNPLCTVGNCPRNSQEGDFLEMAATMAHEIGHYLGLNHPSERASSLSAQSHDHLSDTPQCALRSSGLSYALDQRACYQDSTNTLNAQTCQTACDAAIGGGGKYFSAGNSSSVPNNYCPAVSACQFNHLMWWTTKNRVKTTGVWREDGNLISDQSDALILWNPIVR